MATTRYARAAADLAAHEAMGRPPTSWGQQLQPLSSAFRTLSLVAETSPQRSETQVSVRLFALTSLQPFERDTQACPFLRRAKPFTRPCPHAT
eukprot:scaffold310715_cov32-Tisochrysis_lutea.AAC.2